MNVNTDHRGGPLSCDGEVLYGDGTKVPDSDIEAKSAIPKDGLTATYSSIKPGKHDLLCVVLVTNEAIGLYLVPDSEQKTVEETKEHYSIKVEVSAEALKIDKYALEKEHDRRFIRMDVCKLDKPNS
jgi:hypothetical protein